MSQSIEDVAEQIGWLLAPITDESPCGIDLRFSPELRDLLISRGEEPLPRTSHRYNRREVDWPRIKSAAELLLAERAKDLRIACVLAEAWTRIDRLQGLVTGLVLIVHLVSRYGSQLHPHLEKGPDVGKLDTGEAAALLNHLDLVLPSQMAAGSPSDARSLDAIDVEDDRIRLARAALDSFESMLTAPRVSAPRIRQRLAALADALQTRREEERVRLERIREVQALEERHARMSEAKRHALREREQVVRTLYQVLVFLAAEEPDGLAAPLVERALRLFHKRPDALAQELRSLAEWSSHFDSLPYPTVFDDPSASDDRPDR